jgi:uncharacterized protein (TIGR00297 family)
MSANPHRDALRWQSALVLAICALPVSASLLIQIAGFSGFSPVTVLKGTGIGAAFGLLVWGLRAATPGAALTGALFTVEVYLAAPGWRSILWPVLALFVLTFAATRFGRGRKEEMHVAEERTGRSAPQVAANLGAAALAAIPISAFHSLSVAPPILGRPMLIGLVAALAEATADTVSSELGEVLGGEPVLLTTLRRVPAGTDGAISLAGTLGGCAGAALITAVAAVALPLSLGEGLVAFLAGVFGLFVDSLLGATVERSGWLNNDTVNFLSTLAAAISGLLCTGWF